MRKNRSVHAAIAKIGQSVIFFMIIYPQHALALLPREVVVIANGSVQEGIGIAQRYIRARNIPKENFFEVDLGISETLSRHDYDSKLAQPLRKFLQIHPNGSRIRCLLLFYGMPLKVDAPPLTKIQTEKLTQLNLTISDLRLQLSKITYKRGAAEKVLDERLKKASEEKMKMEPAFRRAALDSELMLVIAGDYSLEGWQPNPFFLGFNKREDLMDKNNILMVSRLDGPNPDTVLRILADTFAAEENGIQGKAYFDARWPENKNRPATGYAYYDKSIHKAARLTGELRSIPVVLDQDEKLFEPGACPEAALYCGWYSLAKYVPAFTWARGAVGYHIASAECATLRKEGSQVWCKRMIEEGVAATLGPVEEPYVQSFPLPDLFFPYLVEGKLTLAECYLLSLPYLSWKMVLIGDPLYRPFAAYE